MISTRAVHQSSVQSTMRALFTHIHSIPLSPTGKYANHTLRITHTNCPESCRSFCDTHFSSLLSLAVPTDPTSQALNGTAIGFDLEHKPTFRKGQKAKIAILQFAPIPRAEAEIHEVLLFNFHHSRSRVLPDCLLDVLQSTVPKIGVGIKGDARLLVSTSTIPLSPSALLSFIECESLAKRRGIVGPFGLKALIGGVLGGDMTGYKTKKMTMTNWENQLGVGECRYAAMDAWCAVEIWRVLGLRPEVEAPEPLPPGDAYLAS